MYCTILSSEAKKERERERDEKGNNDFDLWRLEKKERKKRMGIACFLLITWLPGGGEERGGGGGVVKE